MKKYIPSNHLKYIHFATKKFWYNKLHPGKRVKRNRNKPFGLLGEEEVNCICLFERELEALPWLPIAFKGFISLAKVGWTKESYGLQIIIHI